MPTGPTTSLSTTRPTADRSDLSEALAEPSVYAHYAAVFDGMKASLYVDGALASQTGRSFDRFAHVGAFGGPRVLELVATILPAASTRLPSTTKRSAQPRWSDTDAGIGRYEGPPSEIGAAISALAHRSHRVRSPRSERGGFCMLRSNCCVDRVGCPVNSRDDRERLNGFHEDQSSKERRH